MDMPSSKSRKVLYVAASFVLVGLAATAAVVGSTQVPSIANIDPYNADDSDVASCDVDSEFFDAKLPKWDPSYTEESAFYNACYYSFRCCTTTSNGDGCYVSDEYGDKCRSCLSRHPPKVVKPICNEYVNDPALDPEEIFGPEDILTDDGVPTPTSAYGSEHYYMLADLDSCWVRPGTDDILVSAFTDKCFEVLSWCNLLCPRDTANSVEHVMCKHCTLFGYSAGAPDEYKSDIKIAA